MAAQLPDVAPTIHVRTTSVGMDPASLSPGVDVVLHAPRVQGDVLPTGVLLDDWVDAAGRERIDRVARRHLADWREARDGLLTVAGIALPFVHEQELYADVFLRETRVVEGLRLLVSRGAKRVELFGVDDDLASCLTALLGRAGAAVERGEPGPSPALPITFEAAIRRTPLVSGAREATGIPARVRGSVLVEPYWHLTPLLASLAEREDTLPVLDPTNPPALSGRELAHLAARGGWIGSPGSRARRSSRRALTAALQALAADPAADPLGRLMDARATRLLAAVGHATLAEAGMRRRAFGRGGLKAVLSYSDTARMPRLNALVAREHGASVVCVQHGLLARVPHDEGRPARVIDGWVADLVGVWSERDARTFSPHVPGRVEVTGNPGATGLLRDPVPSRQRGHALVLGQMPSPLSTVADARVTARHLRAALAALSATRPGTAVAVRPHPLDGAYDTYRAIAADFPRLTVAVSAGGTIEAAIAGADLCVGAASTATLQAAAMGRASVMLDVAGMDLAWPFDRSGDFPVARDAGELQAVLEAGLDEHTDGRRTALAALGARPDALKRVTTLVADGIR